jgi:hypothetical protein
MGLAGFDDLLWDAGGYAVTSSALQDPVSTWRRECYGGKWGKEMEQPRNASDLACWQLTLGLC